MRGSVSDSDYWRLKVLIHTHDTFKREAERGVSIKSPRSHASLARAFLAEFCKDHDLLEMVQNHDVPFALWRQCSAKGHIDSGRLDLLLIRICNWNLFLAFCIIDGCTQGKPRDRLRWFFQQVSGRVDSRFTEADLL